MRYPFLDLETVNRPYFPRLQQAAARVVASGRYVGGEEIELLEHDLKRLTEADHVIATSNGLDALHLILEAYKTIGLINEGDEVIVPANTYIASVLAIVHTRLKPVLVDPDPLTMNLSAEAIEAALTPRTKAVMPVHLYGRIAWDADMASLVKSRNLITVEDAAQAIGAKSATPGLHGSSMAGGIGDAAAISFYPTKNIGALGDAGAAITHNPDLAKAIRALLNYGSDTRYHNILKGFNCRMDPIQAAMLRVKLPDVHSASERRRCRAQAYIRHIDNPLVILPAMPSLAAEHVWHQFVIRISHGRRNAMQNFLLSQGVGTDIHYPTPPHRQPCFRELASTPLPLTDTLCREILSLPISDCTSLQDIAEISEIINSFQPPKPTDVN